MPKVVIHMRGTVELSLDADSEAVPIDAKGNFLPLGTREVFLDPKTGLVGFARKPGHVLIGATSRKGPKGGAVVKFSNDYPNEIEIDA